MNTSTTGAAATLNEGNPDLTTTRLSRDCVGTYTGEMCHEMGKGWNREYDSHLQDESRAWYRNEESTKRRAQLIAFEAKFHGGPWANTENTSTAMSELSENIVLAVELASGFADLQAAALTVVDMEHSKINSILKMLTWLETTIGSIYATDTSTVLKALVAEVKSSGTDHAYETLYAEPEKFGTLKGHEYSEAELPGVRLASEVGIYHIQISLKRQVGKIDTERLEALQKLVHAKRPYHGEQPSRKPNFLSALSLLDQVLPKYAENKESTLTSLTAKQAATETRYRELEASLPKELGAKFYPEAVAKAMEKLNLQQACDLKLPLQIIAEAYRIYEINAQRLSAEPKPS